MPLLKRARREIRRHSRSDDCPCVLRFQKAAPGSRFTRREERAGSGLVPEPCRLARNRHASPRSRQSLPSPQFFVANANGSPRRLFTFSSPSSSPAPYLSASPFGSQEASAVALDRLELRAREQKKSLSFKKKKKTLIEALFYQRYQNLNCKRASVRPPPPSSAPSLVSGFQSESWCALLPRLFLVLKRERIRFLNLRPDAQGREDLGGRRGMKRRERERGRERERERERERRERETEWEREREEREGARESQRELLATLLRL